MKMHWYDGGILPERPEELELDRRLPESGTIFVGEKGKLITETYSESPRLIPETRMKAYKRPKKTIPRVQGSHEQNWVDAIKGKTKATSNFDYSGPFTEAVLLGNVALMFPGTKLLWDGPNMKITNVAAANDSRPAPLPQRLVAVARCIEDDGLARFRDYRERPVEKVTERSIHPQSWHVQHDDV